MTSVFGRIGVECPPFELLKRTSIYEVRRYPALLRAEVDMPSARSLNTGDGFRSLANYIFGGNTSRNSDTSESIAMTAPVITEHATKSEKIAMTAPVLTQGQPAEGGVRMAFVLPSKYTSLDALPVPLDPNVKLTQTPERTYAVIQFNGYTDQETVDQKTAVLVDAVRQDPELELVQTEVRPLLARYNPPWAIGYFRTNEVMVEVAFKPKK